MLFNEFEIVISYNILDSIETMTGDNDRFSDHSGDSESDTTGEENLTVDVDENNREAKQLQGTFLSFMRDFHFNVFIVIIALLQTNIEFKDMLTEFLQQERNIQCSEVEQENAGAEIKKMLQAKGLDIR